MSQPYSRVAVQPLLTIALALTVAVALAQTNVAPDEPPPEFKASALLTAAVLKGPNHSVDAAVRTEGYFHEFTITSPLGQFEANGLSEVAVRVHEIDALAKLHEVSKTEVFLTAAGQSVVNLGKGVTSVVTKPEETVKGIGSGFKRFGVNLGRRTERAIDSARSDDENEEEKTGEKNAAEGAANSVLGVNSAMRRWAQKVGVDPYSRTAPLVQALEGIAKVDVAGSIATKVAIPVPQVIGMTASVGDLVWSKDPEALRKLNEERARELGVHDDVAAKLFRNKAFTLTMQTRLIAALHAVRPAGGDDYVTTASEAKTYREALFFVESAELLERWRGQQQVRLLTDSRALVAATDGRATALLPLDWIRSTAVTSAALKQITDRVTRELGATELTMVLTGRASTRAAREIGALGWKIAPAPRTSKP